MDVKVGLIELGNKPIPFILNWCYYYCGKLKIKTLVLGQVEGLTHLLKRQDKIELMIRPYDYEKMKVILNHGDEATSISNEDEDIFKKRFNFKPEDIAKPLFARAINNLTIEPKYEKSLKDKTEDGTLIYRQLLKMKQITDPSVVEEYVYPRKISNNMFTIGLYLSGFDNCEVYADMSEDKLETVDIDSWYKILNEPYNLLKTVILTKKDECDNCQLSLFDE